MAKAKKSHNEISEDDFRLAAFEHIHLGNQIKELEKKQKTVRKTIDDNAEQFVVEQPSGHREWVGEQAGVKVQVQYRKSVKSTLVPEADELLKLNKLGDRFIETVEEVNTQKLEEAVRNEELSPALVQELYQSRISYSLHISTTTAAMPTATDE